MWGAADGEATDDAKALGTRIPPPPWGGAVCGGRGQDDKGRPTKQPPLSPLASGPPPVSYCLKNTNPSVRGLCQHPAFTASSCSKIDSPRDSALSPRSCGFIPLPPLPL